MKLKEGNTSDENKYLFTLHSPPASAGGILIAGDSTCHIRLCVPGVEYLLIKQETVRLEGYYHSTGTLTASSGVLYKDARGPPPIWRAIP